MSYAMFNKNYVYKKHHKNTYRTSTIYNESVARLTKHDFDQAYNTISTWPNYHPTPLISLPTIANELGVANIMYKDESKRFHLKSFKALGGSYAVHKIAEQYKTTHGSLQDFVVCTATDGNHGRSVAWGAELLGIECHIFIHQHVSEERANAMAAFGATIHRIDGNYDDSIAACSAMAASHNWQIISDTSWDGYMDIPLNVMSGYSVMTKEIIEQWQDDKPTHIIIQAGCGGMAGAILANFWHYWHDTMPEIIIVESYMSDCVYEAFQHDHVTLVDITEETIMAGLSCGEVSHLAWPLLRQHTSHVITITDDHVSSIMRYLAHSDAAIEAGECCAAGFIGLMTILQHDNLKQQTQINDQSRILIFGTEGATDEVLYNKIMNEPSS